MLVDDTPVPADERKFLVHAAGLGFRALDPDRVAQPDRALEDHVANAPPMTKRYQLIRFNFGKATSRAPIIMGMTKLPRTVGIEGMRKNQTISTP